jgi:hypothetical protein
MTKKKRKARRVLLMSNKKSKSKLQMSKLIKIKVLRIMPL